MRSQGVVRYAPRVIARAAVKVTFDVLTFDDVLVAHQTVALAAGAGNAIRHRAIA